jgi:protein subunit release factor B
VKDHRTGHERTDYETVLRGDIQDFIDAELNRRRSGREKKA